MKYNYQKHIKLIKYRNELRKQGKLLILEDRKKAIELSEYTIRILDQLHWLNRNQYLQLIMDFLNSKLDGNQFDEKFSKMFSKFDDDPLQRNCEQLKIFKLNPESRGFAQPVSEIYESCEQFFDEYNSEEEFDPALLDEKQLREDVKNSLSEIQKYL